MPDDFWIKDVDKSDEVAFVAVGGRIGTTASQEFLAHCEDLLEDGSLHTVIDMSAVDFIASSGAGALVILSEAFRARKGTIQIMSASNAVKRVIELLNIDRFVTLVNDKEEAQVNLQTHGA